MQLTTVTKYLKMSLGADLRSLALFRIGISSLIILDLLWRSVTIREHYTDIGVLPSYALMEKFFERWDISLLLINGTLPFQIFMFSVAIFCCLLLMVGYKTRWMSLICWVLLVSVQDRIIIASNAGDTILRMALFWGFFMPWGAKFSIDSALNTNPKKLPPQVVSVATAAAMLQLCFMYWFTWALKTGKEWENGSALGYALRIDTMVNPAGRWLNQYETLTELLTHATMYLELLGPILVLLPIPFLYFPIRMLVILSFWGFHIGIALTMEVGVFSFTSMFYWFLVFAPSLLGYPVEMEKQKKLGPS